MVNTNMTKRNKIKIRILLTMLVLIAICVSSCGKKRFDENEIIGLTSIEIVEKYGDFDRIHGYTNKDGLYRNCDCGYLVREATYGFFGKPPEYFMIYFDEEGYAIRCKYEQVV